MNDRGEKSIVAKGYKNKGFPPWESAMPGKREGFTPYTYSLLNHASYRNLTPEAKELFQYMRATAKGNKEFTFPRSAWKDLCAPATFQKRKRELIDKGFIDEVENNANLRKANVYRFSSRWWQE